MYIYEDKKMTEFQFKILEPKLEAINYLVESKTLPRGMMTVEYIKAAAVIHKELFGGPNTNLGSGNAVAFMFKQLQQKINEFAKSKSSAASESTRPAEEGFKGGTEDSTDGSAGIKTDSKATEVRRDVSSEPGNVSGGSRSNSVPGGHRRK
jgi:hypothetical protein